MRDKPKSEVIAYRIVLSGKLQKIGFRKWIQSVCSDSGVNGWVKNRKTHLPTQVVDLLIEGTNDAVHCVLPIILKGSDKSEILTSSIIALLPTHLEGFSILTGSEEAPFGVDSDKKSSQLLSRYREQTAVLSQSLIDSFKNLHLTSPLSARQASALGDSAIIEYIPESTFKAFKGASLSYGASFTSELWTQTRFRNGLRSLNSPTAEMILNNKEHGLKFAAAVGLCTPLIYDRYIRLNDIRFSEKTVIKPTSGAGAKAVYLIYSKNNIKDIALNRTLTSYHELREAMLNSLKVKHAKYDLWQIEELIVDSTGSNANDLKALAFYGEVVLIQEIKRPPMRVCYYGADGNYLRTGRHEGRSFKGSGLPRDFVKLAEDVSLKIPAPFMRIDFYKSDRGPVYGEFTPRPGGFHEYNLETDRKLGRAFIKARARLFYDIYHGKKFSEFDALVADIPERNLV